MINSLITTTTVIEYKKTLNASFLNNRIFYNKSFAAFYKVAQSINQLLTCLPSARSCPMCRRHAKTNRQNINNPQCLVQTL